MVNRDNRVARRGIRRARPSAAAAAVSIRGAHVSRTHDRVRKVLK